MPKIERECKRDYFAHLFWTVDAFRDLLYPRDRAYDRYIDGSFHLRYLKYEILQEVGLSLYSVKGKKGYLIHLYGLKGERKDSMEPIFTLTEQRIAVRIKPRMRIIMEEILSNIPGEREHQKCYSVIVPPRKMSKRHKQFIERIVKRIMKTERHREPLSRIF